MHLSTTHPECIHQLLEEQAEFTPDAVAVVFGEEQLTYRELDAKATLFAAHLQSLGLGPDGVAGICLERGVASMVGILAILKAGGAYLPLDPAYPRERLAFMLEDSRATLLLTQAKLAHLFPDNSVQRVLVDVPMKEGLQLTAPPIHSGHLAYIIYTSGSTGMPKGIAMPHGPLVNLLSWQRSILPEPARTVQFASLGFDVSFQEIFSTWCSGGTLILLSEAVRLDPAALLRLLASELAERLFLPFVALQQLAEAVAESGPIPISLRDVITAGEQLRITPSIAELFEYLPNCALHNHYGPSETHVVTAFKLQGPPAAWPSLPPIGRPIANTQIHLLDARMLPVPPGVAGELCVAGESLCRGYLHRPELTATKFVPNPFEAPPARLYKTGDMARLLPGGEIEFLGRLDHQIKLRGYRVEPGEIEMALRGAPGVRDAVVVPRDGPGTEKMLVAYVVPDAGETGDETSLKSFLKTRLPEYMVPACIEFLSNLPLTVNGKLDREALPAPLPRTPSHQVVAPRNLQEHELAEIWQAVLNREQVGVRDNFFDLGGHSLLAVHVRLRITKLLGVQVPLSWLFEYPTIEELANQLKSSRTDLQTAQAIEKVDRQKPLPMSFNQQRMWLSHQALPDRATYNEPIAWHFSGRVDREKVRRALQSILERHEILRTSLVQRAGALLQQITPAKDAPLPWNRIDLRDIPPSRKKAALEARLLEEARRPFDLTQVALWRAVWIELANDEHVLALTFHHGIVDEWSLRLFFRELEVIYAGLCEDIPANLPELPIQYADYSAWQRRQLTGRLRKQLWNYWTKQLSDLPPPLELPADLTRPPEPSGGGGVHDFQIPDSVASGLRALASQEGTTLFTVVLAAFHVWLHRYTGQTDLIVCTPITNRDSPEVKALLGCFLDLLPMRTQLDGNQSFTQTVRHVRQTILAAFDHARLPFEQIAEIAMKDRTPGQSLYQVMFVLLEEGISPLRMDQVRSRLLPMETRTSKTDLILSIQAVDQSMACRLEYASDLFSADRAEDMARHLAELFRSITENPQKPISRLNLLGEAERNQILVEWNRTERLYPRDKCIHEVFEEQVKRTPDAAAIIFKGNSLSYRELDTRANRLANHLRGLGVGPDVLVGLCLERSFKMIVGLLGVLKAGGAYVPIDTTDPVARWHSLIESAGVRFLVCDGRPDNGAPNGVTSIDVNAMDEGGSDSVPERITNPLDLACVFFTSGSTGAPKGVAVPHRAVLRLLFGIDYVHLGPEETLLQMAPISFDAATFELWGALLHGGRCVLFPERVPTVAMLGELLRRHHVTTLWLTSSLFNLVIDEAPEILRNVRQLLAGGEALSVRHVRRALELLPGTRLINGYGPTEGTTFTCCYTIRAPLGESAHSIPIGKPISNTQVHVLDSSLNPLPAGVPGELYIGGDGLARGYLNQLDLTAEKFIANPFSADPNARLYRTGDLARYLPDGNIEFLGRLDHQVKIRGFRVELGEIEEQLNQHPSVRTSVVVTREAGPGDKRLTAYIVNGERTVSPSELREHLLARLPHYMVPAEFVTVETLPLTPNGKVDRKALIAFAPESPQFHPRNAAPSTPLETRVARIWQEMLGCERIGVLDNFFEFGGHSLLAVRMLARLEAVVGKKVSLATLFAHPTIRALARELDGKEEVRKFPVLPIQKEGAKTPFFFFYGDAIPGPDFCFELGEHLGGDQPLYVVSPPDLHKYPAYPNLQATAQALIESLRDVQPEGPYLLGGYCYGGIVAYETARQLEIRGERVKALFLVDSFSPVRPFLRGVRRLLETAGPRAGLNRNWQRRTFAVLWNFLLRFDGWMRLSRREKFTLFPRKFGLWLSDFPRHLKLTGDNPETSNMASDPPPLRDTVIAFLWELAGYSAGHYSGRMDLLASKDAPVRKNDVVHGWEEFVATVEVHQIPGNHGGCITTHRHVLFEKLRTCIEQIPASEESTRSGRPDLVIPEPRPKPQGNGVGAS